MAATCWWWTASDPPARRTGDDRRQPSAAPGHLKQLAKILDDPEATDNDRFVAYDLLKNANISAPRRAADVPGHGHRHRDGQEGPLVWTDGDDESAIGEGIRDAYLKKTCAIPSSRRSRCLRKKTRNNLPAQIEIYAEGEDAYKFLYVVKGGGSANKTFLYQAPPSILTHDRMLAFLKEKNPHARHRRLPALPSRCGHRRHLGGTDAEGHQTRLHPLSRRAATSGGEDGHAFRDLAMEEEIHKMTQALGVGAQFGGKYFCHDVRVIRLPRHGASLPIGLGVSCSADRQALGKITKEGVFLEELEHNPAQYLPDLDESKLGGDVVQIDLNQPMEKILATLSKHPIKTRLSLSGPMIVARDLAHAKIASGWSAARACPIISRTTGLLRRPCQDAGGLRLRLLRADHGWPHGFLCRPVPVLRRVDGDARQGNRSAQVREACARHKGFYLGSIGGPRRGWHRTASKRSRCSNIRSLAWRRSGKSRWRISPPSS